MIPTELIAALAPSRLPASVLSLGWPEALALFGIGLLVGTLLAWLLSPLLVRKRSTRALIRATRGIEGQERLLAIARIRGHLPKALRPAAYGAAPMPSDDRIERLARGRK